MNRIAKVWEELDKKNGRHANLNKASKNVKLSMADDMQNLITSLNDAIADCQEFFSDLASANYDFQEAQEQAREVTERSQIGAYDKLVDVAYEMMVKIEKASEDLGIDSDEIFNGAYGMAENLTSELEDKIRDIDDEFDSSEFRAEGFTIR